MKLKSLLWIIGLVIIPWAATLAGGGWTQSRRSGYFKLGQNLIIARRYYQPSGEVADITTISLYTSSVYLECGFSDRLTGVAYVPFFVRSTLNRVEYISGRAPIPGDFVNSIGDANVGLKYGVISGGPVVVAASLTLGLPLGETAGGDTRILQTGDGEFNQLIAVEASRSFGSAYATILLGFNNRTQNFSDELRYGLEIGYTWGEKLLTQLRLYGVESLMNGNAEGGGGNSIFANNTEYLAITPEVAYNIRDNLGVSINVGFAAFGRKILAAPNVGAGLFYTF